MNFTPIALVCCATFLFACKNNSQSNTASIQHTKEVVSANTVMEVPTRVKLVRIKDVKATAPANCTTIIVQDNNANSYLSGPWFVAYNNVVNKVSASSNADLVKAAKNSALALLDAANYKCSNKDSQTKPYADFASLVNEHKSFSTVAIVIDEASGANYVEMVNKVIAGYVSLNAAPVTTAQGTQTSAQQTSATVQQTATQTTTGTPLTTVAGRICDKRSKNSYAIKEEKDETCSKYVCDGVGFVYEGKIDCNDF